MAQRETDKTCSQAAGSTIGKGSGKPCKPWGT
ncbi:MAG: hypothetical protein ACJA2S_001590, partial [Cyclobacteriaceae bacterium]